MKPFIILSLITFFSFALSARTIIISDLDETLRIAHSHSNLEALQAIKNGVKAFPSMGPIFEDYNEDRARFFYVSASYFFLYDALDWIKEQKFPVGPTYQRVSISEKSYPYKVRTIKKIFSKFKLSINDKILFFGDNSSHDEDVYLTIVSELKLSNAQIYIRDIKSMASSLYTTLPIEKKEGINYFFSEYELLSTPLYDDLSLNTIDHIRSNLKDSSAYKSQYVYLSSRIKKYECDKLRGTYEQRKCKRGAFKKAQKLVQEFINNL